MIAGLLVGSLITTGVASGIPQYGRSLELVSMTAMVERVGEYNSNIHVTSSWIPLSSTDQSIADSAVSKSVDDHFRDLVVAKTRLVKTQENWWGFEQSGLRTDELASLSAFQFIENADSHLTYITGHAPTSNISVANGLLTLEASVEHDRARLLQIQVGDVVVARSVDRDSGLIRAVITGTFEQTDPDEVFWLQLGEAYLEPSVQGREQPLIMLVDESAMFGPISEASAGLPATYDWFFYTDNDAISTISSGKLKRSFEKVTHELEESIARPFVITELQPRLDDLRRRAKFGSIPMILLALLIAGCSGFFLVMSSSLLAKRRDDSSAMLRSRGYDSNQQTKTQLAEALSITVPVGIIAPLLSLTTVSLLGFTPSYREISGGGLLISELSWTHWIWSLGASFPTALLISFSSSFWDRRSAAQSRAAAARPDEPPWFQRFYVDALLVVLSGILWWEISSRQEATTSTRTGSFEPDLTLLFAPVLIVVSSGLLLVRVFPYLVRYASNIASASRSSALMLGSAAVARRPYFHGWPMLTLALAVSTSIIAGTVISTLERSSEEQIQYFTGSDIHVVTTGSTADLETNQFTELSSNEGVRVASPAIRSTGSVGTTSSGILFTLLGIEPIDFQRIAWFRDDFTDSEDSIQQLIDRLAERVTPEPIVLPANAERISVWYKSDPVIPRLQLWVILKDATGEPFTISFGDVEAGWVNANTKLPNMVDPIEITSIQTRLQVGPDSAPTSKLFLDDLRVETAGGVEHVVLDFESKGLWKGLPTSQGEDTFANIVNEDNIVGPNDSDNGVGMLEIELGRGSSQGVRGIYRTATDRPLPLLVDEAFLAQSNVGLRRPFVMDFDGDLLPAEVIDTVNYFPTVNPNNGPFAIADVRSIRDFVELRGNRSIRTNEAFIGLNERGRSDPEVLSAVRDSFRLAKIISLEELSADSFVDPVAVIGWKGVSLLATAVSTLVVLLAYTTFFSAHSLKSKGDSAVVLALGATVRNHWISTFTELMPALVTGVLAGIATGIANSLLMIQTMAHTQTGERLLPPFLLQTNLALPTFTIAVVILFVLAGVTRSAISYRKIKISEMARAGFDATT